jgi:hypothetical protein
VTIGERQNIELKVADDDPAATERACRALGAVDHGVLEQRDTYYAVEQGRLKLREDLAGGTGELSSPARRVRPPLEPLLARPPRPGRPCGPADGGAWRRRRDGDGACSSTATSDPPRRGGGLGSFVELERARRCRPSGRRAQALAAVVRRSIWSARTIAAGTPTDSGLLSAG